MANSGNSWDTSIRLQLIEKLLSAALRSDLPISDYDVEVID